MKVPIEAKSVNTEQLKYSCAGTALPVTSFGVTETGVQPEPADEQIAAEEAERPSLLDRQKLLKSSPGYRATALKDRIKRMGYVFQGNVSQYKSLVATLQNPAMSAPIFDVRNPQAHDELLSEAERLLHNVLTAMHMRVDHQRRFMKKYFQDDSTLTREYDTRVASMFKSDPQAAFLKDLRNYTTHVQLPVAQSRQTFDSKSFAITFILPSEPLLAWGGWNGTQRAWIASQGEAVAIVDAVDSYACKAGEFDKWLFDRIGFKYRNEIDAYLHESAEFNREIDRVIGG